MNRASLSYLGPYRLVNVVNTGQTSQVWQAHHDGLQKFFALKTLLSDFQRKKQHIDYLKLEAQVGSKLSHPNVVGIHEYGMVKGVPYLAMEWFSSPNMKQWLRKGLDQYAHLVPKIVVQAGEGLAYFNDQGWVHRDVKPDNFMVTEEGDTKLIDFALAQRAKGALAKIFSSKSKVQGTRSYISPEQIRGKPLDGRADLYSYACSVFELAGGRLPFTGASAQELLQKHLNASPPSLSAANANVTPEFADLVRRSMAKRAEARPASVREFLDELGSIRIFKQTPEPPHPDQESPS